MCTFPSVSVKMHSVQPLSLHFNVALRRKSDSAYDVSTKVTGLGTTYDVTSREECI